MSTYILDVVLINLNVSLIDNIKQFGREVLDLIQKQVGVTRYHNAYNKIKENVMKVRRERKNKKVMMVINIYLYLFIYIYPFIYIYLLIMTIYYFKALIDPEYATKRKIKR